MSISDVLEETARCLPITWLNLITNNAHFSATEALQLICMEVTLRQSQLCVNDKYYYNTKTLRTAMTTACYTLKLTL